MDEPNLIVPIEFTTNTWHCYVQLAIWVIILGLICFVGYLASFTIFAFAIIPTFWFLDIIKALKTRPSLRLDKEGITHSYVAPSPIPWHFIREAKLKGGWDLEALLPKPKKITLALNSNFHTPTTKPILTGYHDSLFRPGWHVTIPVCMFPASAKNIIKAIENRMVIEKNRSEQ